MGAGASIDVSNSALNETHIVELMKNKDKREKLFKDIDEFHKNNNKGRIGLKKIIEYFVAPENTLYPGFKVNTDIVSEALEQVIRSKAKRCKKSENSKNIKDKNISIDDFHAFFPIMLLFQRLWLIFESVDGLIVNDKKILKGEFMKIRENLHKVDDLTVIDIHGVSEQEWEKSWNDLNTNNDELISFHEVCEFTLNHVHKAFNYDDYLTNSALEEDAIVEQYIQEEHPTGQGFDGIIVTPQHAEGWNKDTPTEAPSIATEATTEVPTAV